MITLGIDIGSTTSKCVLMKDGQEIIASSLRVGGLGTEGPAEALAELWEKAGITADKVDRTIVTGYGRNKYEGADGEVSELTCHALGGRLIFPGLRTLIDIGGQDVKVMHIDNGAMTNFQMNDKCAAGTGRFLDVMARVLEVKVAQLGELGAQSTRRVEISSTCTVFAESEVISQLANATDKKDIIAGIHRSVAHRVTGLARRIGVQDDVVMTGGVAQNRGIVDALQEELGVKINTSPLTQYNGALGAALFAAQIAKKRAAKAAK